MGLSLEESRRSPLCFFSFLFLSPSGVPPELGVSRRLRGRCLRLHLGGGGEAELGSVRAGQAGQMCELCLFLKFSWHSIIVPQSREKRDHQAGPSPAAG